MLTMRYYIYLYGDPSTGKIFYVGKGSNGRYKIHLTHARNGRKEYTNPYLINKIRKIFREEKQPLIHRICFSNDEKAVFNLEKIIIERVGLENLCNFRDGGEGGYSYTEGQKEKARQITKKYLQEHPNPFKGKKHTPESIEQIKASQAKYKDMKSQMAKGRRVSEETRKKMSESAKKRKPNRLGSHHSQETKKKISLKKTNIKQSDETIRKRIHTMLNIRNRQEYRANLSAAVKKWWNIRKGVLPSP